MNKVDNQILLDAQVLFRSTVVHDLKTAYDKIGCIPTSDNADAVAITWSILYHSGTMPQWIARSRGHSMRVKLYNGEYIARINDPFDHREGIKLERRQQ